MPERSEGRFYFAVLGLAVCGDECYDELVRTFAGRDMEGRLQGILATLLRAKFSGDKAELLREANIELEVLRFQVRLAKDLGILAARSHGHAADVMHQVGSQIGGWAASRTGRQ